MVTKAFFDEAPTVVPHHLSKRRKTSKRVKRSARYCDFTDDFNPIRRKKMVDVGLITLIPF